MIPKCKQTENRLNKLENNNVYSEEEQVVGKWTDGHTIYRRIFWQPLNAGETVKDISTWNIKEILGFQAIMKTNEGVMFPAVYYAAGNDNARWYTNNDMTKLTFFSNYGNRGVIFTLEYTKTTD